MRKGTVFWQKTNKSKSGRRCNDRLIVQREEDGLCIAFLRTDESGRRVRGRIPSVPRIKTAKKATLVVFTLLGEAGYDRRTFNQSAMRKCGRALARYWQKGEAIPMFAHFGDLHFESWKRLHATDPKGSPTDVLTGIGSNYYPHHHRLLFQDAKRE